MTRPPAIVVSESVGATIPAISGYGEFEIDIERVLRTALPPFLDSVTPAPLTPSAINALPPRAKGAYMLLLEAHPVYVGKTDTRHGFRDRLNRHAFSVRHRVGLDPLKVSFKAARIMVFSAFDVEAILIAELRRMDSSALRWNDSGFGSNDPGRRRDGQEPAFFDREFPVDVNQSLDDMPPGSQTAAEALQRLKASTLTCCATKGIPTLMRPR